MTDTNRVPTQLRAAQFRSWSTRTETRILREPRQPVNIALAEENGAFASIHDHHVAMFPGQ